MGHSLYIDEEVDYCRYMAFGIEHVSILKYKYDTSNKVIMEKNQSELLPCYNVNCGFYKEKVHQYFSDIISEMNSDNIYSQTLVNSYAGEFLVKLLRKFSEIVTINYEVNIDRKVDEIKTYLDKAYKEDLSLEDLAAKAMTNKFNLINEFKQAFRVTPIDYMILKRIEEAKSILISTNKPMDYISSYVGFNSQSYFNQIFKKKVGLTPSQFRKKHRI